MIHNEPEDQERESESRRIAHASDVSMARRMAKRVARSMGFDESATEEIALVVSELGSNLIQHAGGGTLTLRPVSDGHRDGLEIESWDLGPGIANVERAVADGYSSGRSLGYGLGTVNRLTDEFEITSPRGPEKGTSIVCQIWLRHGVSEPTRGCPLEFGVATRPHPGMRLNGDAYVIKRWGDLALAAVIDGLGHGDQAHRAAQKARDYVERHVDQELTHLFRGVGRACHGTRGVVMAVVRFDWTKGRLVFGTVGDIVSRVFGSKEPIHFPVRRGILGGRAPNPLVTRVPWDPANVMVVHSDGLTSNWRWMDFPSLGRAPAMEAARELLRGLAKDNDDATVLVVKGVDGLWDRGAGHRGA